MVHHCVVSCMIGHVERRLENCQLSPPPPPPAPPPWYITPPRLHHTCTTLLPKRFEEGKGREGKGQTPRVASWNSFYGSTEEGEG